MQINDLKLRVVFQTILYRNFSSISLGYLSNPITRQISLITTIHEHSKYRRFQVDTVALIIHYVRHDVLRVMRSTKWHAFMIYAVPVWIRRQPTFWWLVIKARHKRATERNVRTIARFASCLVGWILPLWRIAWHWNDGIRKRATTRGALRTTSQWKKPCHGSSSSFVPIKLTSSLFKSDKNGERAFTCIFETESGTIPLWIPSCLSSVDN